MSALVQVACQGRKAAPTMRDAGQNLSHMLKTTRF